MSLPTNEDFANEVKSDRLKIIYQATLVIATFFLVFTLTITGIIEDQINFFVTSLAGIVSIVIGCLITRVLLKKEKLELAVWSYALGGVIAIVFLLRMDSVAVVQIVPFVFPVIIFMVGLLLHPGSTFTMALICTAITILAPLHGPTIGLHQLVAIALMFLSAGFSAQVTGELYQVTEWALMNYQRERRTNDELFEKRMELQKSLKRSEALGTKLKEINAELEVANAAAEEAKHFRGQFLANMSHELRTPLNAIIGFSETMIKFPMMYDDETLPSPYEKDMNQIFNSGRQLLHVINDILDLAKVDAGKLEIHMQRVELEPIISAVMSTAKGLLSGKPVEIVRNTPDVIPDVWADESRVRQILLNLYSNAVKYTDQGEIELSVEIIKNEKLRFKLRDTGIGIDPQFHKVIFEEFKQARSGGRDPRAGTGLGLTISKQLITLMKGEIWVESEIGKGSTFCFEIDQYKNQDKAQSKDTIERPSQNDKIPAIETSTPTPGDHQ